MRVGRLTTGIVLILTALVLAGCAPPTPSAESDVPIALEPIEGTDVARIRLSEEAAERLAIQAEPMRDRSGADPAAAVIPFAAVVYDARGNTWAYTNPEPLVFLRHAIAVVRIEGSEAVLSDGPAPGTLVVTTGAAELYGAETGVGGGH